MIKNYMEILVERKLVDLLEDFPDNCKCERCINDIKAKTLNQLRPLYFVEEKGDVYTRLNNLQVQFETDIVTELIKSINLIFQNPRHD